MKNILLPTDFSANSLNAIEYAMKFFHNWECDFFILNVQKSSEYITDDLMAATTSESIHDCIATDNKKDLNKLLRQLKEQYKDEAYTFHPLFDFDNFTDAIRQAVQFHGIELIIMGTNGATGAKEVVFGSNTLQVIRNVDCPVFAIPQGYSYNGIKKVMFCTHEHEDFSIKGIIPFKYLLQIHQPELHFIELDKHGTEICERNDNEKLGQIFQDYSYTYHYLNQLPDWIAINTASQLLNIDLSAIFVERKTFLERLLSGTDTPTITYGTRIPLLLMHA